VDDARVLMESEARYSMAMGSNSLYLDYATGPPGGGAGAAGGPALDWICDMCSAVNVARCVCVLVGSVCSIGKRLWAGTAVLCEQHAHHTAWSVRQQRPQLLLTCLQALGVLPLQHSTACQPEACHCGPE
jgi:hypothetical protein